MIDRDGAVSLSTVDAWIIPQPASMVDAWDVLSILQVLHKEDA